ncbi:hypothetical protein [Plesiomonas shigelloides]|uniref:Uncharacterized protein n=1 Tax=Plesiomonas shigelloides 302-73 TaxID=1315976 RepID=R8AQZ9_PLESH|nr:hypothetical protein [Plesiomonas shigelloides]EON88747.1 hypothetical protein PLESHI_08994 [Plesiomonas shigelloides 302-73]
MAFIEANKDEFSSDFKCEFSIVEQKLELISTALMYTTDIKPHLFNTWNCLGYVNTCLLDLSVAAEQIIFNSDPWKKRYHARMAALNIYEASLDIPNMFGKEFRLSFKSVDRGEIFLKSLGLEVKKANKFKSEHASKLKNVRLNMAAHREQKMSEQLKIIFNLDPIEMLKLITEFSIILQDLELVLTKGTKLVKSSIQFTRNN